MSKLRFNWAPPPYQWFPTREQWSNEPLLVWFDFESLYVLFLVVTWIIAFAVGLGIGLVIAR